MREKTGKEGAVSMTIIHTRWIDGQAVLAKEDFERLLDLARKCEPVDIHPTGDDLSTQAMMRLAETGGAFDFWGASGEEVYSVQDGEPI
jgi:hypothetical protein